MERYLETPAGWYTIKGRTTLEEATAAAELHREETGAPVALRYCPVSYPRCWKALAKASAPARISGCAHESVSTADGHGAYCRYCGETLS